MLLPNSIDEVIAQLDQIIIQSKAEHNRLGYFALLYREVTVAVKEGIKDGFFEDGKRMEQLDVIFANRYLSAYHQYQTGSTTTQSWKVAFEATQREDFLILQHLLLGMNAHINLDLGIAAATIAPGEKIIALEEDFYRINEILFSMIDTMQDRLSRISPAFGLIDTLVGVQDEKLASFSLGKARDHAWNLANLLAPIPVDQWSMAINTADHSTAVLANLIISPKLRIRRWARWILRKMEKSNVEQNMDLMS